MSKIRFSGPFSMRLSSLLTLGRIGMQTSLRHAGQGQKARLDPSWDAHFETGVRFWRHQFTRAMQHPDIRQGRLRLDSLQTETDDIYPVRTRDCQTPRGRWYLPQTQRSRAVILYLHGGGYAFHGAMSRRFAAMLAHRTGARLFAPDYRLTPEHPHPAQAQDAVAAWRALTRDHAPRDLVVIGDSAGGHMALTLLQTLRTAGLPQPALCIGLCPWTDIGPRGDSLTDNDPYDLVQGWMALQFGAWLDPQGRYGRQALSPVAHDFAGLAPLYLQTGGREILRDMILDFARIQAENGADVICDLWPDMPHDFQAYDRMRPASVQALDRIGQAIAALVEGGPAFGPGPGTTHAAGRFAQT